MESLARVHSPLMLIVVSLVVSNLILGNVVFVYALVETKLNIAGVVMTLPKYTSMLQSSKYKIPVIVNSIS